MTKKKVTAENIGIPQEELTRMSNIAASVDLTAKPVDLNTSFSEPATPEENEEINNLLERQKREEAKNRLLNLFDSLLFTEQDYSNVFTILEKTSNILLNPRATWEINENTEFSIKDTALKVSAKISDLNINPKNK
jgi:hypothetical protein